MDYRIKKKNRVLVVIVLLLVVVNLGLLLLMTKMYYDQKEQVVRNDNCEQDQTIPKDKSADNYDYIGIYSYVDDENNSCSNTTNLVLNSDYSAIFYVGDCEHKAYYYGRYRIDMNDKKIYLYDLILQDSLSDEERKIDDDSIHFNLTSESDELTSIYGRSESVRLKKLDNAV